MATIQQLEEGLRKAHAAGNAEHAKRFADAIRKQRGQADFSGVSARVIPDEAPETPAGSSGNRAQDVLAGVGKSMVDTVRGVRQYGIDALADPANALGPLGKPILRAVAGEQFDRAAQNSPALQKVRSYSDQLRQEEAERRELLPSLSEDPYFGAGNIVATLAQIIGPGVALRGTTAGGALMPATVRGNALQGGALGTVQPTASEGERGANQTLGTLVGAAGAAIPKAAGGIVDSLRSMFGGQLVSGAERAAAQRILDVAANPQALQAPAPSAVPGVQRTLAQETADPGVAALERMVRGRNPGVFGPIDAANNEARMRVLQGIAGTDSEMAAAEAARSAAGFSARQDAMQAGPVDITQTINALDAAIANSEGRSAVEPALRALRARLIREQESAPGLVTQAPEDRINVLDNVRQDVGDMLAGRFGGENAASLKGSRELLGVRDALNDEIGAQVPRFADYLNAYRQMSQPINRMEVGRELISRSTAANPADVVGTPLIQAARFGNAFKDMDAIAASATSFKKAKAENILSPQNLAELRAIDDDMTRIAITQRPTATNSTTDANQYLGEQVAQAGIKEATKALPFGLGALSEIMQDRASAQTQQKLAYMLANPSEARRVLAALPAKDRATLNKLLIQLSARPAAATPALAE